jgi:hypothetical protein
MIIYNSCDDLPIYFFYKIFETKDFRYLIKDFNSYSNSHELSNKQKSEFEGIFNKIMFEYSKLSNNNKLKLRYELQLDIVEMEIEYEYCVRTIDLYLKYNNIEVLLLLKEFDYDIDENGDIKKQILKINNKLKGLKNKIRIKKIRYTKLFKDDEDENIDSSFLIKSLEKEAIYLRMNLGLNIDTKNTSVTTWLSIKEINKAKLSKDGEIRAKSKRSYRRG